MGVGITASKTALPTVQAMMPIICAQSQEVEERPSSSYSPCSIELVANTSVKTEQGSKDVETNLAFRVLNSVFTWRLHCNSGLN